MINITLGGRELRFETREGLFSPQHPDRGTLALFSVVTLREREKALDLGCGWGLVGVYLTALGHEVTMCDRDPEAVRCSAANAELNAVAPRILVSDGLDAVEDGGYSLILSNPPYQADFSVPKKFIEQSFRKLSEGGRLYMVTKRLDWYRNKIGSVFGGVRVTEADGYYVFMAEKRLRRPKTEAAPGLSKKLRRKYGK